MLKKNDFLLSEDLTNVVVQGMQEKKAHDIVVLDLRHVPNSIADFFVVCSGKSDTQVSSISDAVEEYVHKNENQNPWHKEGNRNNEWVLLDYVDVVAHIFQNDRRNFFALEDLWGDAKITKIAS